MSGIRGHYIYNDKGEIIDATGGLKTAMTIKARLGEDHFRNAGRKGGLQKSGGGFASDKVGEDGLTGKQRAAIAGRVGGLASRRGRSENYTEKTGIEYKGNDESI